MAMLIDTMTDIAAHAACEAHGDRPDALIEILHDVQAASGYISDAALATIAEALNLTRAEVLGTVSFYHDFRRSPGARHVLQLCRAEACQAAGGDTLAREIETRLGQAVGETVPGRDLEIRAVYCLGNCALGPAALLDGEPVGRLTADALINRLAACGLASEAAE